MVAPAADVPSATRGDALSAALIALAAPPAQYLDAASID
jgi:hypothetical protein